MYNREILTPRASPIENGRPLTGTWNRAFEKVDLLEINKPYRYPLPRWARNYRIKEWQSFTINEESVMLEALFCNLKLYRMAQVLIYDKENGRKFIFRKIKPGAGWQLPCSLANTSVDSHFAHFYFRIHTWLDADTVKLDVNIEENSRIPSLTGHLAYNLNHQKVTPMAVSVGINERRNTYAYKALAPVYGDIIFDKRHINLKQDACSGFFCDYKGFYPYRTQKTLCYGAGFNEKNNRFGFHIAENQTKESNKNNENALWVNGKLTPLPSVLITMPNGPEDDWIIQDLEGMVDLTFTPKEQNKSGINLVLTNAELNAPLGYFNGMLLDSRGKQVKIKNLFGIGEKFNLRV